MIIEGRKASPTPCSAAMARHPDPRLREVMDAFVRHAHAFVREVRLTEEEFEHGLDFIASHRPGHTDAHNEVVLFSDVLGFSTLVGLLNNGQAAPRDRRRAARAVLARQLARDARTAAPSLRGPTPGPVLFADCRVRDPDGAPLAGAEVDVWQASPVGLYENQDPAQADMNLRGRFSTDAEGRFWFRSVRPAGYPVPTDGPVGDLLRAQQRHPYRPAHVHFLVFKPGYKTLITQIFVDDDEHLETDVVFGVTAQLVGGFERHEGPAPDGTEGAWYTLDYDFVWSRARRASPGRPIRVTDRGRSP